MQSLRIGLRNVLRQPRRSLLLGGAIAFGFFVFTLLNGFTGGLVETVSQNFARNAGGHLYISGSEVSDLGSEVRVVRDPTPLEAALARIREEVAATNTRSSARASVIFGSREETLELVGVDVSREAGFTDGLELSSGSVAAFLQEASGLLLPEEVVQNLNLALGERVVLKTTTVTGQQNVGDFVVLGTLAPQSFGPAGAGVQGYARLGALNALLDLEAGQFQTLNVYLEDLSALEAATGTLHAALAEAAPVEPREAAGGGLPNPADFFGGRPSRVDEAERWQGTKFTVTNLNDQLEGVMALVNVIDGVGLGVFAVILVVIMVGVTNAYRMVLLERTAEIGTMRAMGVPRAGVRNIFLWEAFLVALGGTLAGLLLALFAMLGVGLINFGDGSAFGIFLDGGHLRFDPPLLGTLGNVLLICFLSAVAVYLPARAAARLEPAEALRTG